MFDDGRRSRGLEKFERRRHDSDAPAEGTPPHLMPPPSLKELELRKRTAFMQKPAQEAALQERLRQEQEHLRKKLKLKMVKRSQEEQLLRQKARTERIARNREFEEAASSHRREEEVSSAVARVFLEFTRYDTTVTTVPAPKSPLGFRLHNGTLGQPSSPLALRSQSAPLPRPPSAGGLASLHGSSWRGSMLSGLRGSELRGELRGDSEEGFSSPMPMRRPPPNWAPTPNADPE